MEARTGTPATARGAIQRGWTRWLAFWRGRPRWLRRTVWTLLAVYGAYLLLGNLFLNTPLGTWTANRKPEKFQAQWGPAVTLFPGHVVARDVRLQGQVRNTSWDIQAERVRGRVALWPLLAKEVRVPSVVASGVTGGARHVRTSLEPPPPRPGPAAQSACCSRCGAWPAGPCSYRKTS